MLDEMISENGSKFAICKLIYTYKKDVENYDKKEEKPCTIYSKLFLLFSRSPKIQFRVPNSSQVQLLSEIYIYRPNCILIQPNERKRTILKPPLH